MNTINSDDDDDYADGVISTRGTQNVCSISQLKRKQIITAILLLYNQQIIVQLLMISGLGPIVLPKKKKKRYTCKRKRNSHRYCKSVIEFIHSWSDSMFQRQFRLSRDDFYAVHEAIINHKASQYGYEEKKLFKFATLSSGSPVTLELRLFITLRILSGASYLDMIGMLLINILVHNL